MDTLRIDSKSVDLEAMIDRGVHLHGHLGPFLVAGIRMGLLALELLKSPGYFGIAVVSQTGSVTPLSCLTDGIQIGSGCTTGKGNLRVTDKKRAQARFTTDDGRSVTIAVRPEVVRGFRSGDVSEASRLTMRRPVEELFTWEIGAVP